jgi:hypothetical protein
LVLKKWYNQNGFPKNKVSDITIDATGFLQSTTLEGLVRLINPLLPFTMNQMLQVSIPAILQT